MTFPLLPTAPGRCQLATVCTGAASFATFCTRTEVALANVQEFADPERFRQQIKPDQKEMRRGCLGRWSHEERALAYPAYLEEIESRMQ